MSQDKAPSRGEQTRARLLQAALRSFGREGYDAVSIRQIAERADANIAAINYHFGGKHGLYEAVANQIAQEVRGHLTMLVERTEAQLDTADADQKAYRAIGAELLRGVLDHILRTGGRPEVLRFILEEQIRPGTGFDIIYQNGMGRLHRLVGRLVAGIEGGDADDPAVIIKSHAIIGQCLAFVVARATLCRRLGVDGLDDQTIAQIYDLIPKHAFGLANEKDSNG